MNINLDKNAIRSVLMDLWEQCARDYNFENCRRGGIYNWDDDKVTSSIIDILEGRAVIDFIIDINGFYQPHMRLYKEELI